MVWQDGAGQEEGWRRRERVSCRLRFITFRHGVDGGRRGKEGGGKGGLLPTSNENEEMSLGIFFVFHNLLTQCRLD
jgi:hypothetical protein